jgi:AraC-like DNA-binding protein
MEGIAIVSVYRNLDAAHLGSPKRLLIAAKVLRGFGYLRDPGYSVLDVSIKLGYKTARIFSHHWVSVFGLTPARVRNRLTDDDAVGHVLRWIRAGEDDSNHLDSDNPSGFRVNRPRRRRRTESS